MIRYCAIDLSGIFRTWWHATEHKPRNEAFKRTLNDIHVNTASYQFDKVAICCDTRAPTFRHEMSPDYKANRGDAPVGLYDALRDAEYELSKDFHVFRKDGFEADDLCASFAWWVNTRAVDEPGSCHLDLVSFDKDIAQCVTPHVSWINPRNGEVRGPDEVLKKYGVPPKRMAIYQALMGDKADNIPGISGIGATKAVHIAKAWPRVDLTALEKLIGPASFKKVTAAAEHGGPLWTWIALTTLNTSALTEEECERLGTAVVPPEPGIDPEAQRLVDKVVNERIVGTKKAKAIAQAEEEDDEWLKDWLP